MRTWPHREGSRMPNGINDGVILAGRLFLAALFLIFGWRKLRDYSGTVSQCAADGIPLPQLAAAASIFMELPVAFAIAIGACTRVAAVLFAFYTMGTSLAEHRYWAVKGPTQLDKMEAFYKNLSIIGGFLLLFVTGAGKYSVDALLGVAAR
jgi:putative oxidoreductase